MMQRREKKGEPELVIFVCFALEPEDLGMFARMSWVQGEIVKQGWVEHSMHPFCPKEFSFPLKETTF
jgi:hypothetical protein